MFDNSSSIPSPPSSTKACIFRPPLLPPASHTLRLPNLPPWRRRRSTPQRPVLRRKKGLGASGRRTFRPTCCRISALVRRGMSGPTLVWAERSLAPARWRRRGVSGSRTIRPRSKAGPANFRAGLGRGRRPSRWTRLRRRSSHSLRVGGRISHTSNSIRVHRFKHIRSRPWEPPPAKTASAGRADDVPDLAATFSSSRHHESSRSASYSSPCSRQQRLCYA